MMITLTHVNATATISPYGAQVMSYMVDGHDVLWQTEPHFLTEALEKGKALRGGIPVCWPWFNKWHEHPEAPSHGFARLSHWNVEETTANHARLTLTTDGTHPFFPHEARAELTVTLSDNLHVNLTTTNLGATPFKLTQGLHTYLRVEDIKEAEIHGLHGLPHNGFPQIEFPETLKLDQETDTIISNVSRTLHLYTGEHETTVQNEGTTEAVLWNPWQGKSAQLDMTANAWRNFVCLESVTLDTAPTLGHGQSATLTTRLTSHPRPHPEEASDSDISPEAA